MHKARLGMLPDIGAGVLLLSNLGGSVGGPLTALKFGVATLLAGGSMAEADATAASVLNTTAFWKEQWLPSTTCSRCGRSLDAGPCKPAGLAEPPLPLAALAGLYGSPYLGKPLQLQPTASGDGLTVSFGPLDAARLLYSNTSAALPPQPCSKVAAKLSLAPYAEPARPRLAALAGTCTLVELIVPPEVPAAGLSVAKGTLAFPWACGYFPMPYGATLFAVAHEGKGIMVVFGYEALWSSS